MLRKIIEVNKLELFHDIWPEFRIFTSGGVAFEPFQASLQKLFGREVHFMDTYLASEGFFAYNARPHTSAMRLALENGIYFEFIPFNEDGFDEHGELLAEPVVHAIDQCRREWIMPCW
ncbi:MAG: GH3 auxin-responsive promoter family protein [Owenweeksia sp.]|nr:GH3 auxin-responsive promoter family protein [Owenweeksia sp.]